MKTTKIDPFEECSRPTQQLSQITSKQSFGSVVDEVDCIIQQECPLCSQWFSRSLIEQHASTCKAQPSPKVVQQKRLQVEEDYIETSSPLQQVVKKYKENELTLQPYQDYNGGFGFIKNQSNQPKILDNEPQLRNSDQMHNAQNIPQQQQHTTKNGLFQPGDPLFSSDDEMSPLKGFVPLNQLDIQQASGYMKQFDSSNKSIKASMNNAIDPTLHQKEVPCGKAKKLQYKKPFRPYKKFKAKKKS